MTAMERIKDIEHLWVVKEGVGITRGNDKYQAMEDITFLLRAFKVMREVACSGENGDFGIDAEFERRMKNSLENQDA